MGRKKTVAAVTAMAMCSMALAGCRDGKSGEDQASTAPTVTTGVANYKACMVSGLGGFDDKSFNQASLQGLQRAAKDLDIGMAVREPEDEKAIPAALEELVGEGCGLVVTVGFELGPATAEIARRTPSVNFATVDWFDPELTKGLRNLRPMLYSTTEPAFMAGYLSASMTTTGTIATYGGLDFPSVTSFMDGFHQGAARYSQVKKRPVKVLGWNPDDPKTSSFAGDFGDAAKGEKLTKAFAEQGADVVFPVAGNTGRGSLAASEKNGDKPTIVWVDTDGCTTVPDHCPRMLTSVEKRLDTSVYQTVRDASLGRFTAAPYVGTLVNGGVALGELHDFADKVPAETKKELEQLASDIVSGKIKITKTTGSAAG